MYKAKYITDDYRQNVSKSTSVEDVFGSRAAGGNMYCFILLLHYLLWSYWKTYSTMYNGAL